MAATRYSQRMARLRALEPKHTRAIQTALLRQAEQAIALLQQFDALPNAVGIALIAARITSDPLLKPLQALYVACGTAEARDTYEHLTRRTKAQAPAAVATTWAERLRAFITTEGAAAVAGITNSTRRVVREVLNEAIEAGIGIREASRNLRAKVQQLAPQRARLITRTELLTAANTGSLLGAQATGLPLLKRWLSTPGLRTRPSHRAANGQTVSMQGAFTVGGISARYPGDPLLSAKERCNCRCTITYVLKD